MSTMRVDYTYRATVVSVHDGDTLTLDVDLGFYVRAQQACRLLGINAPELSQAGGASSRDFLRALLPPGTAVTVRSVKADKYGGRFDGIVAGPDGLDVAAQMITAGHALAWDGTGTKPV